MAKTTKNKSRPEIPPSLPPDQAAQLLRKQYEKGRDILRKRPISEGDERAWKTSAREALILAFGSEAPAVRSFDNIGALDGYGGGGNEVEWEKSRARRMDERLKVVEGLIELLEAKAQVATSPNQKPDEPSHGNRVFLVHGHNKAALEATARFLERLDLETIILHEQPNEGRTIIEKFIDYSNVGFAVVLLTDDDIGGSRSAKHEELKPRARQNVVFELGFFIGKLGRKSVCALYQPSVEIPSDYSGVLFIPLDTHGGWKLALAKEMKTCGLDIDMNKAL